MKQRVITAIIALAIFIPILIIGGNLINIAVAILACIGIFEIYTMRKRIIISLDFFVTIVGVLIIVAPNSAFNILPDGFTRGDLFMVDVVILLVLTVLSKNNFNFDDAGISTISMLYIGTGFYYMAKIRNDAGIDVLLFALIVIWCTDIGAYMVGRKVGKNKLLPEISPNKTVEGSLGGIAFALIAAFIYINVTSMGYDTGSLMLLALIMSIVGQTGDLIESAYKRHYGVKDSGKILPGHGGILDRFDSTLLVLPIMHLFGIV